MFDQLEALRAESCDFLARSSSSLPADLHSMLDVFFTGLDAFCEDCTTSTFEASATPSSAEAAAVCGVLSNVKNLWTDAITSMESSLKRQRAVTRNLSAAASKRISSVDRDLAETAEAVPCLNLAGLRPTIPRASARSSSTFKYTDESELISHRSPFTGRSRDLSSRPKRMTPPLPPVHSIHSESELSVDLKHLLSFDKKEADESIHASDVKRAIRVLKKARVLSNNQLLLKLAEAAKDPDNSVNLDLLLQNLSFSRQSKRPRKPPTPQRVEDQLALTSPKGLLSPSGNLQHTLLTSEHLFSARDANGTLDIDVSKGSAGEIGLDELLEFPDASVEYQHEFSKHKDLLMSEMDSGYRLSRNSVTKESTANSSARVTHKWRPILSAVEDTRVRAVK